MIYRVTFARDAQAYLDRLGQPTRGRIERRLDQIAADPFGPQSKALTGVSGLRSARVGGYRILFSVDTAGEAIVVTAIASRGQVYRDL